jgi:HEAT repeat protein
MIETLRHGKPHEQAIAMAALGDEKRKDAAVLLSKQLVHPIPIVRWYAANALAKIFDEPSPIDLHTDDDAIASAAAAWLARHDVK